MKIFMPLEIVSFTPAQQNQNAAGETIVTPAKHHKITMKMRPEYIVATNLLDEGPVPEAISIVYFDADSGVKPVLSTEHPDDIEARILAFNE